jgi:hypothetical protein
MALTEDQIQIKLDAWYTAEVSIATSGQEYTIDTGGSKRTLRRADLQEIRRSIDYWEAKLLEVQGKRRPFYVAKNW